MNLNLLDTWRNRDNLVEHLARQLVRGRLGLFLGAGVSSFYGLPSWETLVSRLCADVSEPALTPGEDVITRVGALRARHFRDDPDGFRTAVKRALYEGVFLDFEKIRQSAALAAIGSLVMASKRGSAAKVITLNYDDLLENYLEFHGFVTTSVWKEVHWANNDDVTIYHPHGFLPLAPERKDSADIVLGTREYFDVMASKWRPMLESYLRTHTFIYIGLSGADMHLQSLINGVGKIHAITEERILYHTVRFAVTGKRDDVGDMLEAEGVFTHKIADHDEIPRLLFAVSQAARRIRAES